MRGGAVPACQGNAVSWRAFDRSSLATLGFPTFEFLPLRNARGMAMRLGIAAAHLDKRRMPDDDDGS